MENLAVVAYTYMNSKAFEAGPDGSIAARTTLAQKAFNDIASAPKFDEIRGEYQQYLSTGIISPLLQTSLDSVRDPLSLEADGAQVDREPMLTVGRDALLSVSPPEAQLFGTIFGQMRVPMALKYKGVCTLLNHPQHVV